MAIRNILREDCPRLRKVAKEVTNINQKTLTLLDDLAETMYNERGVGLAAPQVGILKRIAVIDTGEGLLELINPVVKSTEGQQREEEGCLSLPDDHGYVIRPEKVVFTALNRDGKEVEYVAEGLFARAAVHEIDHLDGVLFTDKIVERVYPDDDDDETQY